MLIFLHYYNIMKFIKKLLEKLSFNKQIHSKDKLASRRIKHYDDCY